MMHQWHGQLAREVYDSRAARQEIRSPLFAAGLATRSFTINCAATSNVGVDRIIFELSRPSDIRGAAMGRGLGPPGNRLLQYIETKRQLLYGHCDSRIKEIIY